MRIGRQEPRLRVVPAYTSSLGPEAVDLAASTGLILDPWQDCSVCDILATNDRGLWAALETDTIAQRQQGKGGIIETIELGGLFLFGERLILHSAHEYKTAQEAFLRISSLIEGSDDLTRHVKAIREANGEQQIILMRGCCKIHPKSEPEHRLRFVARSKGSGRGFSGQRNILDETFALTRTQLAALMPTMSAQPNPQLNRFSTVPDADTMPDEAEAVLPGVHARALIAVRAGVPGRHCYLDWSVTAEELPAGDPLTDPEVKAAYIELAYTTNPAMGIRISEDYVAAELDALGVAKFCVERLGLWPGEAQSWLVITKAQWLAVVATEQVTHDPVVLALESSPDRLWSSLAVAGGRPDGDVGAAVIEHAAGLDWTVARVVAEVARQRPCRLVVNAGGAAASVIPDIVTAMAEAKARAESVRDFDLASAFDVELVSPTTPQRAAAYGMVHDALTRPEHAEPWRLWCRDHEALTAAVAAARPHSVGAEGTTWEWTVTDASPLKAVTHAVWGFNTREVVPVVDIAALVAWR